nr:RNA-dependent RNA polymerase [Grapevine Cabernet Sauvignon reovirus]
MFKTLLEILISLTYQTNQHFSYLKDLQLLDDKDQLYGFLRDGDVLKEGEIITGTTIAGNSFSFEYNTPKNIRDPPPFDPDTYFAETTSVGFADITQPNYLVTCDVRSVFQQIERYSSDELPIGLKVVKHMLTRSLYQSRVGNIWRQLLAIKLACLAQAESKQVKDPISRCIATLLVKHQHPPFWESRREVQWLKTKTLSILPLLLYAVSNLGTQLLAGNITEMEVILCFQIYLIMAENKYQDTKLSLQKKIRSWLREGLHKLNKVIVPRWSPTGVVTITSEFTTREFKSTMETLDKVRKQREESIPPLATRYINQCMSQVTDVQCMLRSWIVTRIMANDGTYFASQPALTLDKAVKPKLCTTVVPALRPVITLGDSIVLRAEPIPNSQFARAVYYTDRYVERTVQKLLGLNWEESFVLFLTSSSSGRDFQQEVTMTYSNAVRKVIKSRVFAAGLESESYYSLEALEQLARLPSKLVGRDQIGRRQRAVAGVNNAGTLLGFPALRILETMLKLTKHASSGKQTGTFIDLIQPLSCFSSKYYCFNSSDVEGMDASVQANVQQIMWNFVLRVASRLPRTKYFAYNSGETTVMRWSPNESVPLSDRVKLEKQSVTGIQLACARAATALQPQNCQIKDDILGFLSTREPTFPSGLPFTGAHHSYTLISGAQGEKWSREKKGSYSSTQIFHEVQGDDELFIYHGLESDIEKDMMFDMNATRLWGFNVDPETSRNTCEFLQQRVALGRFVGYPDRVSLFTAERPREGKSLSEKMSEILGLGTDLGPRSANPQGLVRLYYAIAMCCCARITLKASSESAAKLIKSEFGKKCGARLTDRALELKKTDHAMRFEYIRMYYPICALWHEQGGMLPPLRCYRSDGSLTDFPSYYFMRGDRNRRWLWDISNTIEDWKEHECKIKNNRHHGMSPGRFLNNDLIDEYFYAEAAHLVTTCKSKIVEDYRINDAFTMDSVDRLSRRVDGMRDQAKINVSLLAQGRLAQQGILIPDGMVVGHQIRTRMLDAVRKAELTEQEDIEVGDMYVNSLLKFTPKIDLRKTDSCLLYYVLEGEKYEAIPHRPLHNVIDQVSLSLEVFPYSDAAMLLKYCGLRSLKRTKMGALANGIQGRYGPGKMNQEIFKFGLKIAAQNSKMLPDFYAAVGVPLSQRPAFEEAFNNYELYHCMQYRVVKTPRQFFFCDDSGEKLLESCSLTHPQSSHPAIQALAKTILLSELASKSVHLTGNRMRLVLLGTGLISGRIA